MNIHGLQKMTLLDYPGHVACTVFLGGCDLRCPFCHNYELAIGTAPAIMDEKELLAFLEKRRGILDGVAITGGEPCLRKDHPELLAQIREMGYGTKLDTNGFHPEMLRTLLDRGLVDYAAVDIKNSPAKYALTSGVDRVDLEALSETIRLLMEGSIDYEFRTTVVKELHTAEDMHWIGGLIRGSRRYFLQAFTDRDTVPFEGFHAPDKAVMEHYLEIVRIITPGIPDKKLVYSLTRSYYHSLVRQGVRVYEYTPGFCHCKMCVTDDTAATCGTINMDYRSLYHHFENGCLYCGCEAVLDTRKDFEEIMAQSREVTEDYRNPGSGMRLIQAILRLFAPLL